MPLRKNVVNPSVRPKPGRMLGLRNQVPATGSVLPARDPQAARITISTGRSGRPSSSPPQPAPVDAGRVGRPEHQHRVRVRVEFLLQLRGRAGRSAARCACRGRAKPAPRSVRRAGRACTPRAPARTSCPGVCRGTRPRPRRGAAGSRRPARSRAGRRVQRVDDDVLRHRRSRRNAQQLQRAVADLPLGRLRAAAAGRHRRHAGNRPVPLDRCASPRACSCGCRSVDSSGDSSSARGPVLGVRDDA